ncbi:triose-phosphate isomerase [bacterium]|nr:triose-phosphate isomerase [bacterium]
MDTKNPFFLFANWKMNLLREEALRLCEGYHALIRDGGTDSSVYVGAAVPSLYLAELARKSPPQGRTEAPGAEGSSLYLGVQNVHHERAGAFTGEISVPMAQECGATFSLIGHSERRQLFSEGEELLQKRARGALEQGLSVVYCVGETLSERESGITERVLRGQLESVRESIQEYAKSEAHYGDGSPLFPARIIVAYEPVWAIGTGRVAGVDEIRSAHRVIKAFALEEAGAKWLPVLYGGSVKPTNIDAIAEIREVDGALVGGASLEIDSFAALYSTAADRAPAGD